MCDLCIATVCVLQQRCVHENIHIIYFIHSVEFEMVYEYDMVDGRERHAYTA